ncbi:MAG: sulfotransferase family protein [Acidimicrobiales bacterium]
MPGGNTKPTTRQRGQEWPHFQPGKPPGPKCGQRPLWRSSTLTHGDRRWWPLCGEPCYHMTEMVQHGHVSYWSAAGRGEMPDWGEVFAGYAAAVDWPAAAYWPEISATYPEAVVLLSSRASAEEWYQSASATIFTLEEPPGEDDMHRGLFERFGAPSTEPAVVMAAYEAHNQRVRDTVPLGRLVDWRPGDGWATLRSALGLAMSDEPFPHVNTTPMFQERLRTGE